MKEDPGQIGHHCTTTSPHPKRLSLLTLDDALMWMCCCCLL